MDFVRRLKDSDQKAIDELYDLFKFKIFRFSVSYLKVDEDAYDIVQDVFISLWEKRISLNEDSNIEAYLFTLARNNILSLFRKRASQRKYLEFLSSLTSVNTIGTEQITNFDFLNKRYYQLIEQLPPKRKEIFLLSREKTLSVKEIARLKGISEKTVADHITKTLSFFRKNMNEIGFFFICFLLVIHLFMTCHL